MVIAIVTFDRLLTWFTSNFTAARLCQLQSFIMKQGKSWWMGFKAWFWGLNCDIHEAFVRRFMPIMPVIEDDFEQLEERVNEIPRAIPLSECIEQVRSVNEEFNEYVPVDEEGEVVPAAAHKAAKKQTHRIRMGMLQAAAEAVELELRTKHGVVPANELNEQSLKMSAIEICRQFNLNSVDTYFLCNKPVAMAMIPCQKQLDNVRIIYNNESSNRRASIEALRNSEAYSHFKSGHYC